MSEATDATPTGGMKEATEILGIRELPSMTVLVTAIAQPFAQLAERFELPHRPLAIAGIVSLLFAIYSTMSARKMCARDCVVLVPLISLALFATSLGTNNVISAALRPPDTRAVTALASDLETVKRHYEIAVKQLELKEREVQLQEQAINELLAQGRYGTGTPGPRSSLQDAPGTGWLAWVADRIGRSLAVHAAEPPPHGKAGDARADVLKRLDADRKRLAEEQKRLDEEQKRLAQDPKKAPAGSSATTRPAPPASKPDQLWRSW